MKILTIKNQTFAKCDVFMIPTATPEVGIPYITSRISSWFRKVDEGCKGIITSAEINNTKDWTPHHIYIVTNTPLQKNDWVINTKTKKIFQLKENSTDCKRIVATTDKTLHVPSIDGSFIEACCKFNLKQAFIECEDEYNMGSTMAVPIEENSKLYIKIPVNLIHLKNKTVFV